MCNTTFNEKGISLVEVSIALFLLGFGALSMISLQPSAWRLSGKSDYLGRASGILLAQLQVTEAKIMNPNIPLPVGTNTATTTVYAGGQSTAKTGDVAFTVRTTTDDPSVVGLGSNIWRVTVQVTWPGGTAQGIKESLMVARQATFSQ
jgi:Tfp pilus assembly protein PilV